MENKLLKDIQNLNKLNNFRFKRKLGQNFLIDNNVLDNIIKFADIDNETLILEIGTGAGALTEKLALNSKQVITYEIDNNLKPFLDNLFKNYNNIEIIFDDFLKRDIKSDIERYSFKKILIIANIPYYITTPIINKILMSNINVMNIILMIQKEAIERLVSKIGTKDYSSLSILIDYYFEYKKLFQVSRNSFFPKPNIDSVVIQLKRRIKNKVIVNDEKIFFKLIHDSFVYRRKNLRNNLKDYDLKIIEEILKKYNFDLNVRAESISIDIFADLANNLFKN